MHAWQRAMGPVTSASKIVRMHSVTATKNVAEHSPLRDNQRLQERIIMQENKEVWQNSILKHALLFYLFVLVRFNHKQGDSRHVP